MEERKTILVVDDDKVLLLDAKKKLQDKYKVVGVSSAKFALEYLKNHVPNLILLDIMMPDLCGFDLFSIIKEIPGLKRVPVIFLTADTSSEVEVRCFELGAVDFLVKPIIAPVMLARIKHALMLTDYTVNLQDQVDLQLSQIMKMQNNVLISFANLIESRDLSTGGHVKRTARYVAFLLKKLLEYHVYEEVLNPEYISRVIQASPLHDIGKIMVSDVILNKPEKFTDQEYEEVKKHAQEGRRLILTNLNTLAEKEFIHIAADMAGYHHERWLGQGYPEGLKGEEIPLCARIMAVADVFDALTSIRCYKDLMPFEQAVELMRQGRNKDFEGCLVDCFLADLEELKQEIISTQEEIN